MNRNAILSGNTRQYISVTDCYMLEMIEKLLPHYKSFNRLVNDALQYGLPMLMESKLGDRVQLEEEKRPQPIEVKTVSDESIAEIVKLLQEIVMNTTINKSVLCSLFNAKSSELKGKPIPAEKFDSGAMRDTPTCFMKYEIDMLNAMDND
ncbi:MAG: hypothetical protein HDQ88_11535 [Clostridia bacterium]|nr:hypothetical protein [Clostridia bacterium]